MQRVLEAIAIISDAIHRADRYCSPDVFLFTLVCRLLVDVVVGRVVAVHEILQRVRETEATAVAIAGYVVLARHIIGQSVGGNVHKKSLLNLVS